VYTFARKLVISFRQFKSPIGSLALKFHDWQRYIKLTQKTNSVRKTCGFIKKNAHLPVFFRLRKDKKIPFHSFLDKNIDSRD
jgi:hypothetical protein